MCVSARVCLYVRACVCVCVSVHVGVGVRGGWRRETDREGGGCTCLPPPAKDTRFAGRQYEEQQGHHDGTSGVTHVPVQHHP